MNDCYYAFDIHLLGTENFLYCVPGQEAGVCLLESSAWLERQPP